VSIEDRDPDCPRCWGTGCDQEGYALGFPSPCYCKRPDLPVDPEVES